MLVGIFSTFLVLGLNTLGLVLPYHLTVMQTREVPDLSLLLFLLLLSLLLYLSGTLYVYTSVLLIFLLLLVLLFPL